MVLQEPPFWQALPKQRSMGAQMVSSRPLHPPLGTSYVPLHFLHSRQNVVGEERSGREEELLLLGAHGHGLADTVRSPRRCN